MRITFILPVVHQNGGCRVVSIYAQKLIDMGHTVTVVARKPFPKKALRKGIDFLKNGHSLREEPNRTAYFDNLDEHFWEIEHTGPFRPEDLPDADIAIATWWRTAFFLNTMPPQKGKKAYFVQGHEATFDSDQNYLAHGSYYLPLKKIVISQWLQDIMADTYGDRDVFKVTNSVDTTQFDASTRARNTCPTVGFIFSRSQIKGADTALEALEQLKKMQPKLKVKAFGIDQPNAPLALPSFCDFTRFPKQEDIPSLYASCDVWLSASRSEGFGLPIMEAMACRTPVVSTSTGAAKDLITDDVNGYVVDVGDAKALATRMNDILALSPEAWSSMSEAAYQQAHSRNWDTSAKEFETALKSIFAA